jgi:bifunctional DNA-binding transcriptional regulator/antitoxin component of YhaV-PrlF toxin-antitoxin module
MIQAHEKPLSIVHLSEKGQLTVPAEYRRDLSLVRDSTLVVVRVGDALVLIPHDDALAAVTSRLEDAMRGSGLTVADLLETADEVRADLFRREFGGEDTP